MVWFQRKVSPRGLVAACVAALTLLSAAGPMAAAKPGRDHRRSDDPEWQWDSAGETDVLVVGLSSSHARGKVNSKHGTVLGELPIVDAVGASVTAGELDALTDDPEVFVVPNVAVDVTGVADATPRLPASVYPQTTGASTLQADGTTGQGVTVAVLDTGIAALPDFAGRIVGGVDFSGEGDPYKDSFGHGTFVSGLIAGNGASSQGAYVGEAPGASLASVKVAGASGSTDLFTVLRGLQWTVANRKSLNIGVLNISMGTPPFPSSSINPLDRAVEAVWRSGIVVVTSAGNTGPINGTITSPGDDPMVITAGALDDNGTAIAMDDTMTTFSGVGPTAVDGWFKPDLVAAGRSVVSLRVPDSTIDSANPTARVGTANFVGSGTSFSAAITSGAVAMLRQLNPGWNPDRVKGALLAGASAGPVGNPFVDGFGSLNVATASKATAVLKQNVPALTLPNATVSLFVTGAGSAWNGSSWNGSSWKGSSWNGSSWNGSSWNGSSWNGSSWNGSAWNGSSWNGSSWNGSSRTAGLWDGSSRNGSSWN
ncbi:MAG: serine protease AprX, partial [Acidimicrobiaceae bacterium]